MQIQKANANRETHQQDLGFYVSILAHMSARQLAAARRCTTDEALIGATVQPSENKTQQLQITWKQMADRTTDTYWCCWVGPDWQTEPQTLTGLAFVGSGVAGG